MWLPLHCPQTSDIAFLLFLTPPLISLPSLLPSFPPSLAPVCLYVCRCSRAALLCPCCTSASLCFGDVINPAAVAGVVLVRADPESPKCGVTRSGVSRWISQLRLFFFVAAKEHHIAGGRPVGKQ